MRLFNRTLTNLANRVKSLNFDLAKLNHYVFVQLFHRKLTGFTKHSVAKSSRKYDAIW